MRNAEFKVGLRGRPGRFHFAFFILSFALLLAGCGGGNAPANNASGPKAADLKGERSERTFNSSEPAIDVSNAPTDAHKNLASLLPTKAALDQNSVTYAGWDATQAAISDEDPAEAPIPAVYAEYHSAGYDTLRDKDGELEALSIEYPQDCKLFLIRAPEPRAAEVVEENIRAKMIENGFARIDPIEFVSGQGDSVVIARYSRVDDAGDYDGVYVGYLKVFGDLVVYALETETPPKLDTGESRISKVSEGGGGSRVGGRLISLLYYRLESTR